MAWGGDALSPPGVNIGAERNWNQGQGTATADSCERHQLSMGAQYREGSLLSAIRDTVGGEGRVRGLGSSGRMLA
jgi:hypothetical protein